jgi:hypothetical protein
MFLPQPLPVSLPAKCRSVSAHCDGVSSDFVWFIFYFSVGQSWCLAVSSVTHRLPAARCPAKGGVSVMVTISVSVTRNTPLHCVHHSILHTDTFNT